MTASEDQLASLRKSADRIVDSLVTLAGRLLTEPHVLAAVERLQSEVRQARAVGEFSVLTAAAKLKDVMTEDVAPEPVKETRAKDSKKEPTPDVPTCIPDYANLSAAQIIPLLRALDDDEKAEVLDYEESTRQRKTIISALRPAAS